MLLTDRMDSMTLDDLILRLEAVRKVNGGSLRVIVEGCDCSSDATEVSTWAEKETHRLPNGDGELRPTGEITARIR